MDSIENLKKLFVKENWKYTVITVWLLVGVGVIQFDPWGWIGIGVFLPFLTFLMYIFIFSLFVKRDVKEVKSWKVLVIFFASLPLMFLISVILVVLFAFSIFSYLFFTSWFIFYAAYLSSRKLDNNLKKREHSKTFRSIEFFGGTLFSILILTGYILNSDVIGAYLGTTIASIIGYSNYVVFFVILVIIIFFAIGTIFLFKKVYNAWLGMFFLYLVIYTFYLLVKIFLAYRSATTETDPSLLIQILLFIVDCGILLYTISTLMGPQASLLFSRLKIKRIGLDSVLLWLVLSKVAYEFVHYFPYKALEPFKNYIPAFEFISGITGSLVNFIKNIFVLVFFLLILLILGIYEFRKYVKNEKSLLKDKGIKLEENRGKEETIGTILKNVEEKSMNDVEDDETKGHFSSVNGDPIN
jgi:hypothetical protein